MLRFKLAMVAVAMSMLVASMAVAAPIDYTSFDQMTAQGRAARYNTIIGAGTNHTCGFDTNNSDPDSTPTPVLLEGVYDYVSSPGRWSHQNWWKMADGISTGDYTTCANNMMDTFDYLRDVDPPVPVTEFVGYRFKHASTVTQVTYTDFVPSDGGVFDAAPRVEVLVGNPMEATTPGVWTEIAVNWDTPYSTALAPSWGEREARQYVITPQTPTGQVWGVRLVGEPLILDPASTDKDGWIAMTELQVSGEVSFMQTVDLSTNLVSPTDTPIWNYDCPYPANPEPSLGAAMIDGDVLTNVGFFSPETGADWAGVLFGSAKTNVAAVGLVQRMYRDGGWFKPESMEIQYLPEGLDPDVETNWVAATGLDMGRWEDMEPILGDLATLHDGTNWRTYRHAELLTFNPITTSIDGLRVYGDSEGTWGTDRGFISIGEFEVFGTAGSAGIPGDTDGDNIVDEDDASVVAGNWGATGITGGASEGDFNGDGNVDGADASIMAANWGDHTAESNGESAVPEPSTFALLFLGLMTLIASRRRR